MEGPLTRSLIIALLVFVGTAEAKKPRKPRFNPRDVRGVMPRGNNPLAKAEFYMERRRYRDAVRAYSQILQRNPNSVRATLGRGRAYAEIGRCEKALEDLAIARTAPALWSSDGASSEGYCRARLGDTWGALAAYEEAVAISDDEAPIHQFRLSFARLNVGDVDGAYEIFDEIKDSRRNEGMRRVLEAWLDYESGRAPAGYHLHEMDEALETTHHSSVKLQRYLLEGWSLMDEGQLIGADEAFKDATGTSLQHLRAAVSRAESRRRLGRAEGALAILDRRVLLAENAVSARAVKVRALVDLGRLDEAEELLSGLSDTWDESVIGSFWYLARARGDEQKMEQYATMWDLFAHPGSRTLEQLVPVEGLLLDEEEEAVEEDTDSEEGL